MKSADQDEKYPNIVKITYNDGKEISCKVAVKRPMIAYSKYPHTWLENAETKMIEL